MEDEEFKKFRMPKEHIEQIAKEAVSRQPVLKDTKEGDMLIRAITKGLNEIEDEKIRKGRGI